MPWADEDTYLVFFQKEPDLTCVRQIGSARHAPDDATGFMAQLSLKEAA
jgi:hypothetical protein